MIKTGEHIRTKNGGQKIMKAPQTYKNMNLVKCYKNFALYSNGKWNECFTYYELGNRTAQIKDKEINVSNHF